MKLQGVLILRITDFRRFFDLDEFLVKKGEFCELMKQYGSRPFCNTPHERDLCGVVRNWINGEPFSAEITDDRFVLNGANGKTSFPLGKLKAQVDRYYDKLGFKDMYGLTALYLLAGANQKDCAFTPDYGILLHDKNGIDTKDGFVSLHKDTRLTMANPKPNGTFVLRVLANINAGGAIKVSIGNEEITLRENQCVTGIFTDEGCVTLLGGEASMLPGVYAVLVPDKLHKCANLRLSRNGRVETIQGVSTVWAEPGAGVAYVKTDGNVVFDKDKCFKLNSRVAIFNHNSKERKLLAIKKTDGGNYVLYTDSQIEH